MPGGLGTWVSIEDPRFEVDSLIVWLGLMEKELRGRACTCGGSDPGCAWARRATVVSWGVNTRGVNVSVLGDGDGWYVDRYMRTEV